MTDDEHGLAATDLVEKTRALLRREFGSRVSVDLADAVVDYPKAPSLVVRCAVSGLPNDPGTVVAKRSNYQEGHLRTEWASLRFLAGVPDAADLVPALLAADLDDEVLVIEDLGDLRPRLLGNLLRGDDPRLATAALTAFHEALACLHGATAGLESAWLARVREARADSLSRHRVHRLADALLAMPDRLQAAGVAVSHAFRQECDEARGVLARPGGWQVLTHGDATPANASFDGERVRLFDFETGGFRHALVDGTFPVVRWLHSIWAQGLPDDLRDDLLSSYREALARRLPAARDDAQFENGVAACTVAWLAGLLALPDLFQRDRKWGAITFRERALAGLRACARWSHRSGRYAVIGERAHVAAEHLAATWELPDDPLPIYPALENA